MGYDEEMAISHGKVSYNAQFGEHRAGQMTDATNRPARRGGGGGGGGGGVIHRLVLAVTTVIVFGFWVHERWRMPAAGSLIAVRLSRSRAQPVPVDLANMQQPILTADTCACTKTLLIIIFNVNVYSNVAHIRSLYGPTFCHIAFYGPDANSTLGVRANVDRLHGWLQHQTIAQAYKDHPGYDGYMWCGDDVLFNPWHLLASPEPFSLDKVWLLKAEKDSIVDMGNRPRHWMWHMPFVNNNCTWPGCTDLNAFLKGRLPERIQKRQISHLNGSRLVGTGSDFGYIPARLMPEFAAVVGIEGVTNLIFEIFIPTFARLLSDSADDVAELDAVYLWKRRERGRWTKWFNCSSSDFVHPVKLSKAINREKLRNVSRVQHCSWTRPLPGVTC